MFWPEIEAAFSRAIVSSFSKKKIWLTFPTLILCGLLTVFCRAVALDANSWVAMSLAFFPIFFISGILLALGVLLIRIHIHEVNHLTVSFRRLIQGSIDLMMSTSYLSVPPILAYLLL